jgi:hypothetical protein
VASLGRTRDGQSCAGNRARALANGLRLSGNPRSQCGSHHSWDAGAVDRSKRVLDGIWRWVASRMNLHSLTNYIE